MEIPRLEQSSLEEARVAWEIHQIEVENVQMQAQDVLMESPSTTQLRATMLGNTTRSKIQCSQVKTTTTRPALDASDSDDGFQDFLSEDEEEQTLLDQESVALERWMKTVGIRDGLEIGKEDTLQQGFDEGFAMGAARSFRFGRLRGALGTAVACGLLDADLMTQAKGCMAQLRTLEMDTSVYKDGEKDTSSEADTAVKQAHEMLKGTCIGMDVE